MIIIYSTIAAAAAAIVGALVCISDEGDRAAEILAQMNSPEQY